MNRCHVIAQGKHHPPLYRTGFDFHTDSRPAGGTVGVNESRGRTANAFGTYKIDKAAYSGKRLMKLIPFRFGFDKTLVSKKHWVQCIQWAAPLALNH